MSANDPQNSMNSAKDGHFSLEKPACNIGRTTFPITSNIQSFERRPQQQHNHQQPHHHHLPPHHGSDSSGDNTISEADHQQCRGTNSLELPIEVPHAGNAGLSNQDPQHQQSYHHHHHHPQQQPQTLKPFTCNICGKTLSRRDHLKLHTTIHTGLRPYRCETCGVTFSRNHHLVRHMGSHMSEKRYKCDICGKGLSRSDHLKVHRRIHTGERPFKCQICGFAFSRRDRLVKHNQLNKGRRKLSCVPPSFVSSVYNNGDGNGLQQSQEQMNLDLPNGSNLSSHQLHHPDPNIGEDTKVQLSPKSQKKASTNDEKQESDQAHGHNQEQSSELHISSALHPHLASSQVDQVVSPDDLAIKIPQFPSLITTTTSGHQMTHMMPVFPTTIQMSPATAHIFPTLQMYTNPPQLNMPSSHIYVTK